MAGPGIEPGPLALESVALPTALRARQKVNNQELSQSGTTSYSHKHPMSHSMHQTEKNRIWLLHMISS